MTDPKRDAAVAALAEAMVVVGWPFDEYPPIVHRDASIELLDAMLANPQPFLAVLLRDYVATVKRDWSAHWQDRPDHRYGRDPEAFLGERLLTDFDLRALTETAAEPADYDSGLSGGSRSRQVAEPAHVHYDDGSLHARCPTCGAEPARSKEPTDAE